MKPRLVDNSVLITSGTCVSQLLTDEVGRCSRATPAS